MTRYARTWPTYTEYQRLTFGPWTGLNVRITQIDSSGFVQKPETRSPNQYLRTALRVASPPTSNIMADSNTGSGKILTGYFDSYKDGARNKAYTRLVKEVFDVRANLALTLIDYEKSYLMIAKRLGQLLKAASSLRSGNFNGFVKALGVSPRPRDRNLRYLPREKKYFRPSLRRLPSQTVGSSNLWLEYNFGWTPLISDIFDATKVLSSSIPYQTVKGKGRSIIPVTPPIFIESARPAVKYDGYVRCLMQCRVRVDNPNLLLLNQAGLINPAYVIWDAIPFSFVVDWFIPVGTYLRSWTDFVGLEVIDPFTTFSWVLEEESPHGFFPEYTWKSTCFIIDRQLGVQTFRFVPSFRLSPDLWKAITSLALINQKVVNNLRRLT